jgi:signal transduction histidine kinase
VIDLGDSRLFRTQRQRWVLVAVGSLFFAYGVATTELHSFHPVHAAAAALCAAVAIAGWSLPGGWGQLRRAIAMGAAGAGLLALEGNGPGEAAVFVAIALASSQLALRGAVALVAVLTAILESTLAYHRAGVLTEVLTLVGVGLLVFGVYSARRSQLDRDRARAAELEAAVVEERTRLAREIHDVLAHSLTALVVQLDSARLLAAKRPAELPQALDRARHLAQSGLDDARRAVEALRGDELPGPDSLPALVTEFEASSRVPTAFRVTGEPIPLSSEARLALYRTAQESLTNIRKHSHAELVTVSLGYTEQGAELSIEDTGDGPNELATTGGGFGLTGMRERAELAGGRLEAGPTEAGYRVKLWLPA